MSSRLISEGDDERECREDVRDFIEGTETVDAERRRARLGSRAFKECGERGVVEAVVIDLRDISDNES